MDAGARERALTLHSQRRRTPRYVRRAARCQTAVPSTGGHLTDQNQLIDGVKPYPNFGYIESQFAEGNASYNAAQMSLKRRFTNGIELNVAYTRSKSIDDTPEELENNSGGSLWSSDRRAECNRQPSDRG